MEGLGVRYVLFVRQKIQGAATSFLLASDTQIGPRSGVFGKFCRSLVTSDNRLRKL